MYGGMNKIYIPILLSRHNKFEFQLHNEKKRCSHFSKCDGDALWSYMLHEIGVVVEIRVRDGVLYQIINGT